MKRLGLYAWAGPGTIRMLNTKYFSPIIDYHSLQTFYDYDNLKRIVNKFGVTDIWVTYSWGFDPRVEQEDYEHVIERLDGMHDLGLKVHAYIQGPNLVHKHFKHKDWWCKDENGFLIPYHKGRKQVSVIHPEFVDYKLGQIRDIAKAGFDGVFIDNVQMGQMGMPIFDGEIPFIFTGSTDEFTAREFKNRYDAAIPTNFYKNRELAKLYLDFRVDLITEFIQKCSSYAHERGIEFGSNSFDPLMDTKTLFGTDLEKIAELQDYVLFENHGLPDSKGKKGNKYIDKVANRLGKQVFLVTYNKGISFDSSFSQSQMNRIMSEHYKYKFSACLKGSEYTTKGVWHNLRVDEYVSPKAVELPKLRTLTPKNRLEHIMAKLPFLRWFFRKTFNRLTTWYFESGFGRKLLYLVYYMGLH